jgi:hypothetical protein
MIDLRGGMYQTYQWPATKYPWKLIDWSGDKTRVLLYDPVSRPTTLQRRPAGARHRDRTEPNRTISSGRSALPTARQW